MSGAATSAKSLAQNFDTFLTLLTAQLKNQDPLSPMDATQFTQQLVQFSQVEQQINSNKNIETLIGLTRSRNATESVSYLGKTVTLTDGGAALKDGSAEWTYTLDGESAGTVLTITNAQNKLVYVTRGNTANGEHSFVWDGRDNFGNPLPDGGYTLTVKAELADGKAIATRVRSQGVVEEIDLSSSEPLLMIGAFGVPLSKVALISGN
jgi:flagellar basal-body rod modification protein FlgD